VKQKQQSTEMSEKPKTVANRKKNEKTIHLWWVPSGTVCSKKTERTINLRIRRRKVMAIK